LSTLCDYLSYLFRYTTDIARRHYLSRGAPIALSKKQRYADTLRVEWADIVSGRSLHDDQGLVNLVREGHSNLLKRQRVEFVTMLTVELLFRLYPRIRQRLTFS
jgi:hypothetical protein